MRIPIACTLTADDQPGRLDEWRSFFATQVAAVELPAPDRARLRLADGSAAVLAAADLAQREKQCCGFFEFAIELGAQGRWLSVGVPAEAAPVLADLVDLLPARLRPGTGGRETRRRARPQRDEKMRSKVCRSAWYGGSERGQCRTRSVTPASA